MSTSTPAIINGFTQGETLIIFFLLTNFILSLFINVYFLIWGFKVSNFPDKTIVANNEYWKENVNL